MTSLAAYPLLGGTALVAMLVGPGCRLSRDWRSPDAQGRRRTIVPGPFVPLRREDIEGDERRRRGAA